MFNNEPEKSKSSSSRSSTNRSNLIGFVCKFGKTFFILVASITLSYCLFFNDNNNNKNNYLTSDMSAESADPKIIDELKKELSENPFDPNSFARLDQAKIKHLHLKLLVDFDKKILDGNVELTIVKTNPTAKYVLLDTVDLLISGVYRLANDNNKNKEKIPYKLYPAVLDYGSKLEIQIDQIPENEFKIQIDYRTNSKSRALMWMSPEQTEGRRHPYMYSQCQAINARSIIPCQDTPSVKATYSAEIQAPKELQVLMSAKIIKEPETSSNDPKLRTHFFHQKVPMPSYLIAIAVGNLVSKKIGKISKVWSEPEMIEASAWEFAKIDDILDAAVHFAGDYVWEIYDILVLPSSFPYGGMENPCLTFVTPTLLAGDRSLVYVIVHEVSHSWTGNLVTNANYGHFWLNEGFTVFLERKIGGYLDKNGEKFTHLTALEGLNDLRETVNYYGKSSRFTKLLIDMRGTNPDDVFSVIPYEKGYTLLFYLEQKLGGPKVFEPFLKAYIDKFKYQSLITDDFRKFLLEYFWNNQEKQKFLREEIDWDKWLNSPGMPPTIPAYDRTLLSASVNLATKWLTNYQIDNDTNKDEFSLDEFRKLHSIQQKLFLIQLAERLNESTPVPLIEKLPKMEKLYELSKVKNCEVKHSWIMLGIQCQYEPIIKDATEFINKYGRMKYIKPLYRKLYLWPKTKKLALDLFEANKPRMMRVAIEAIKADLEPKTSKTVK